MHYATLADGTFAFASEIKALLTLPGVDLDASTPKRSPISSPTVTCPIRRRSTPHPQIAARAHARSSTRGRQPVLRQYWNVLDGGGNRTAHGDARRTRRPPEAGRALANGGRRRSRRVPVGRRRLVSSVVAMMAQIASAPVSHLFDHASATRTATKPISPATSPTATKPRIELRNVDPRNLTQLLPRCRNIYDEPFGDDFGDPHLRRLPRSRAHAEGLPHRRRRRRNAWAAIAAIASTSPKTRSAKRSARRTAPVGLGAARPRLSQARLGPAIRCAPRRHCSNFRATKTWPSPAWSRWSREEQRTRLAHRRSGPAPRRLRPG